ncbi:MAG: hypothetical protein Q7J15_07235, partial [Candidatus Desulfaltia sp.]|nr:hypothetical protein [Candidatus Desulfaltia sp.]
NVKKNDSKNYFNQSLGQLILAPSGGKAVSSPSRGYSKASPSGVGYLLTIQPQINTDERR